MTVGQSKTDALEQQPQYYSTASVETNFDYNPVPLNHQLNHQHVQAQQYQYYTTAQQNSVGIGATNVASLQPEKREQVSSQQYIAYPSSASYHQESVPFQQQQYLPQLPNDASLITVGPTALPSAPIPATNPNAEVFAEAPRISRPMDKKKVGLIIAAVIVPVTLCIALIMFLGMIAGFAVFTALALKR